MADRAIRIPDLDHLITIERNPNRVVVKLGGLVLADARNALNLCEAKYPPVQCIPRADADMSRLARTEHATYCPFNGDYAYYSLAGDDARAVNAVWTYESPYAAVAAIRDHLAFYPDRVDIVESA